MDKHRLTWDGTRHPNTIYEVWSFLGIRFRHVKERLRKAIDEFYGKEDRITYLCNVYEAIKIALDQNKSLVSVGTYLDLEQLLALPASASIKPKLLKHAQVTLKPFLEHMKIAIGMFAEIRLIFEEDILRHLETYCSRYVRLGISDDNFYKSLRSRTHKIRGIMRNFEKITTSLRQSLAVSSEYFSDTEFSHELSVQFNCESFPILRIVPDLIQKLETVVDTGQDWLRSDKVYLDQIQKELENTRSSLKDMTCQAQLAKLEYDQLFSLVKRKQFEYEDCVDNHDDLWKDLSKLEAKKTRLEIEVSAVAKTLRGCRDQLRDLSSRQRTHSGFDEYDGHAQEEEYEAEDEEHLSRTHSSYRSRLCRDARTHNTKLDYLRRKKKQVERHIIHKRALLDELESSEVEVQKLCKKLKAASKNKSHCAENIVAFRGLIDVLEQTLKQRLRPTTHKSKGHSRHNNDFRVFRKTGTLSRKVSLKGKKPKQKSRRSADLNKAFRLIKNNIGHNWKDLARMLPYGDSKELTEINNEIRVIEYENQGQLKEQAYQSLLRWYKHCGRRASVEVLRDTLKDINEIRLAESIEKEIFPKNLSEPCTPVSDTNHHDTP